MSKKATGAMSVCPAWRQSDRQRALLFTGALLKQLGQLELAGAKARSQKLQPGFPHGWQKAQALWPSSAVSPDMLAGCRTEVEHVGLDPVLVRDTSIPGNGLTLLCRDARLRLLTLEEGATAAHTG